MQIWHLGFSTYNRHVMFSDSSVRRTALRKILEITTNEVVSYCLVDDHLHLIILCSFARAALLSRAILLAIRPLAMGNVKPAYRRLVRGRKDMMGLMKYHLEQPEKHKINAHPALWEGSMFQDLVSARKLAAVGVRLSQTIPRFRKRFAYKVVGLPIPENEKENDKENEKENDKEIKPASYRAVHEVGACRLVSATGVSLLVGPDLKSKRPPDLLAKRVVAQLGMAADIPASELAYALKTDPNSVRRWQRTRVHEVWTRAVRVRIALEIVVSNLPLKTVAEPGEPVADKDGGFATNGGGVTG